MESLTVSVLAVDLNRQPVATLLSAKLTIAPLRIYVNDFVGVFHMLRIDERVDHFLAIVVSVSEIAADTYISRSALSILGPTADQNNKCWLSALSADQGQYDPNCLYSRTGRL